MHIGLVDIISDDAAEMGYYCLVHELSSFGAEASSTL